MKLCCVEGCGRENYTRGFCVKHYQQIPEYKEYHKRYNQLPKMKANRRAYYRNPEKKKIILKQNYEYALKRKIKVFEYYGGHPPRCACCGESHIEFLAIDHINGGGNAHRRDANCGAGNKMYCWLIKNNFPEGFQVLCFNCNHAKELKSGCPHRIEKVINTKC